jgi:hypothetical protein
MHLVEMRECQKHFLFLESCVNVRAYDTEIVAFSVIAIDLAPGARKDTLAMRAKLSFVS